MKIFYVVAIVLSGIIVFVERAFPFLLFSKKEPPKFISTIEKSIPPLAISSLLIYSLKESVKIENGLEVSFPSIIALGITAFLHIIKKNSMISIFGGTISYMVLLRLL